MGLYLILGELGPEILHVLLDIFPVTESPPIIDLTSTCPDYLLRGVPGRQSSWTQTRGSPVFILSNTLMA